jgi:tetratricopeptide (TPR) repeat protein
MAMGGLWQERHPGQCRGVRAAGKPAGKIPSKRDCRGNRIVIKLGPFMVASIFSFLPFLGGWSGGPIGLYGLFSIWMLVDAIRRREYLWVFLILAGLGFWYFFYVYRGSASATQGFELPGAAKRKRIKELQAQIHHLDNAVHHFYLGDIYFRQGKFPLAEKCYRAALERDAKDIDARAHLGQCLLRQKRAAEARPWLEGVCAEDPKHDFGYSMMALAETLTALGEQDAALAVWLKVTAQHSYARAKVQLAELYLAKGRMEPARVELTEVLTDDAHAPSFQRKRDRVWVRRARSLVRKAGTSM